MAKRESTRAGWVKVHRRLIGSEVWANPPVLRTFLGLLLVVERETGRWPGSASKLVAELGLPSATLYEHLATLKELNMIAMEHGHHVLVLNWSTYQAPKGSKAEERTPEEVAKDAAEKEARKTSRLELLKWCEETIATFRLPEWVADYKQGPMIGALEYLVTHGGLTRDEVWRYIQNEINNFHAGGRAIGHIWGTPAFVKTIALRAKRMGEI